MGLNFTKILTIASWKKDVAWIKIWKKWFYLWKILCSILSLTSNDFIMRAFVNLEQKEKNL